MLNFNKRSIFLFDAVGALLSAMLSLVILPNFSELLGLPKEYLHALGIFPIIYGAYSLSCYFLIKKYHPLLLLGIIAANLLYCLISVGLIIFYKSLTGMGQALLFAEILVILFVVTVELKVYKKSFRSELSTNKVV